MYEAISALAIAIVNKKKDLFQPIRAHLIHLTADEKDMLVITIENKLKSNLKSKMLARDMSTAQKVFQKANPQSSTELLKALTTMRFYREDTNINQRQTLEILQDWVLRNKGKQLQCDITRQSTHTHMAFACIRLLHERLCDLEIGIE